MKPYYEHAGITIYHGDCREILPSLPACDLVLTDPPYGLGIGGAGTIGGAGVVLPKNYGISDWDNEPMSAEEWALIKPAAPFWIVWGANHFADVIGPSHGALIWDKRCKNGWDDTFSECEIAWTNLFTRVKAFRHLWAGALRASEQGADVRQHPTQKPIALMKWCLSLASDVHRVLDPYFGSGPSLIAAKECGLQAIGIEIEEKYCEIAAKRLAQDGSGVRMTETPLTPEQITQAEQKAAKEGYVKRVLIGLDQFVNVITGGKPDETISARSGRAAARGNGFGKFMVAWLNKLQPNHGVKAEIGDLSRAQVVENTEDSALGIKK